MRTIFTFYAFLTTMFKCVVSPWYSMSLSRSFARESFQGYALDQQMEVLSNHEEHIMSTFCIIQSILLVIFASILGAHRSDVVDQSISLSRTKSSAARIPSDGVIT